MRKLVPPMMSWISRDLSREQRIVFSASLLVWKSMVCDAHGSRWWTGSLVVAAAPV